jgi:hypothetical protein
MVVSHPWKPWYKFCIYSHDPLGIERRGINMKEDNTNSYLQKLKDKYIVEVKKFLEALKENPSQNELSTIRNNTRQIFNEIQNNSSNGDTGQISTH